MSWLEINPCSSPNVPKIPASMGISRVNAVEFTLPLNLARLRNTGPSAHCAPTASVADGNNNSSHQPLSFPGYHLLTCSQNSKLSICAFSLTKSSADPNSNNNKKSNSPGNPPEPLVKSLQDLTIAESLDSERKTKSTTFYHITKDEEVYFGQTSKNKRETTIPEFNAALQRIPDQDIYPPVPPDGQLTLAPEGLDEPSVYVKRPGIQWYDEIQGTNSILKTVLDETLVMEKISQSPHRNPTARERCR